MSLADRSELFGQPTETLTAEAVWMFKEEHGEWPLSGDAVACLSEFAAVAGDLDDERRLFKAVADEEVIPRIRGGGRVWSVELTQEMSDRIARRYMDLAMPRRDREDQC